MAPATLSKGLKEGVNSQQLKGRIYTNKRLLPSVKKPSSNLPCKDPGMEYALYSPLVNAHDWRQECDSGRGPLLHFLRPSTRTGPAELIGKYPPNIF